MEFILIDALKKYNQRDEIEKNNVNKTFEFLRTSNNCFSRNNQKGHITAGALIMDNKGNVLLNHHKILNKWLLFGGHSDGEENSLKELFNLT